MAAADAVNSCMILLGSIAVSNAKVAAIDSAANFSCRDGCS